MSPKHSKSAIIRVLIVDDHAVVRRGLRQILEDELKKAEFGEAENAHEALDRIRKEKWDVIVLDINMPGRSGMEVLKEVKQTHPSLPVLVLSMYPEEQYAIRVLKSGAAGYMTKETAPEALVQAVRKVMSGGKYVSSSLAEKLASELDADTEKPIHEKLSDREYEILLLIGAGKTTRVIAGELSLSPKTVDTYRRRVLDKMHMQNNAELIQYTIRHQLVD
ncbi:response regulator [Verrucomicrobiota bacterium]